MLCCEIWQTCVSNLFSQVIIEITDKSNHYSREYASEKINTNIYLAGRLPETTGLLHWASQELIN